MTREKFVLFFKKTFTLLIPLMFVSGFLTRFFGKSVFSGKYFAFLFFGSLLSYTLTLLPPKSDKGNTYAWLFFISLLSIILPMFIVFINQQYHLFVLSHTIKIILIIPTGLGFIGFFGLFFLVVPPTNEHRHLQK